MSKSSAAARNRQSAPPPVAAAPAIDLAHLERMTFGDEGLESEVLRLFDRQAAMLLARMHDAPQAAVTASAHALKGSARGIGAWQVAKAAETIELAAGDRGQPDLADALQILAAAVKEARAAIADLLGAGPTRQS